MEKHKISRLNSSLALDKRNELLFKCKHFLVFILNVYANLVCLIFFNNLNKDVTILNFFLFNIMYLLIYVLRY